MRRIVTVSLLAFVVAIWMPSGLSFDGEGSWLQAGRIETLAVSDIGEITIMEMVDLVDEKAVDWATDRYREARLSLPPIRVSFYGDSEPCNGAQGGHMIKDGVSHVLVCISERGSTRELKVKRTLLHEFAHAWDAHFLTQNIREAFIELHGLEGWSFDVPYEGRGSEHAAETITWGLIDRPILFGSLDAATRWEVQHNGYVTLTGMEPPHGYVWSLFAASHDVYAHTPSQLRAFEEAWNSSDQMGRRTRWVEVRFHRTKEPCDGEITASRVVGDRLYIEACPDSGSDLAAAFLRELTTS